MITKLLLNNDVLKNYKSGNKVNSLEELNRLNVFIGENNSGKSRFLRALFSEENYQFELSQFNAEEISKNLFLMTEKLHDYLTEMRYNDVSSPNISGLKATLRKHIESLSQITLKGINSNISEIVKFIGLLKDFKTHGADPHQNVIMSSHNFERLTEVVKNSTSRYISNIEELIPKEFTYNPDRVYIPILRGLRPTQFKNENSFDEFQDNYALRTVKDYFQTDAINAEKIFTGLRLYGDTKRMLLGKQNEREKIKKFETFLGKAFFNGADLTLIPNISDDSLHVSIGSDERAIYELGDGIQSIIILLYPLFFNIGKDMLVFIEEPENSMHPGLQRLFIETIMSDPFKSFQFFITTHSNHFLDITLDLAKMSVYSFTKRKNADTPNLSYHIDNTSNENSNVLDLIGARNSSVFLSNCTIWVEGITDRLYLKKYLEIYQRVQNANQLSTIYKEDFNFSFVEYSGSNIAHWIFNDEDSWDKIRANRISTKIFLIADKDSTEVKLDSKKAKRLNLLKEVLGDRFAITPGREIENLLGENVLIETIKTLEGKNASNIKYDEKKIMISKYLNKPLGKFISDNFQNIIRTYDTETGTVYCKNDFCKAATSHLKNLNDLSTEALQLVKKIYDFIATANF